MYFWLVSDGLMINIFAGWVCADIKKTSKLSPAAQLLHQISSYTVYSSEKKMKVFKKKNDTTEA